MSIETNPWSAPPSSLTHLSQLHPIEDIDDNDNPRRATSSMSLTPPAPPSAQLPPRHQFITARRDTPPHEHRRTYAPEPTDGRSRTYVPPQLRGPHSYQQASWNHEQDTDSPPSSHESISPPLPRHTSRNRRHQRSHRAPTIAQRVVVPTAPVAAAPATAPHANAIRRETLAGLPSWPPELKLSLSAGNWLEWSRFLLRVCDRDLECINAMYTYTRVDSLRTIITSYPQFPLSPGEGAQNLKQIAVMTPQGGAPSGGIGLF
ncbi:hypothetical protein EDB86DRAFT_3091523 [Lactarius hatsudake]|nr:hypothetical protein EDB86DRAFT_3091523 [Lactarius hatsudake]